MKTQRLVIALTTINSVILIFNMVHMYPAAAERVAPILRGSGLEIVDDQGKVRAQIVVYPTSTTADGAKQPDTALFRLIDPNGRPGVKIGTSVEGSAVSLAGDSERREWSGVQILAKGTGSLLKLTNKDGREQQLKP